jgi:pimeloyl-ACP methyl ester carboxylesterase
MLPKWKFIFSSCCFILFASCHFPVHILTDEQIAKHYANRAAKPELKYLRYKNKRIHYAIVGDSLKPLLIVIHGSPGAWYSSMKLIDNPGLQKNFHIISVDRLGYGKSDYGVAEPSIQHHVQYIEKLVEEYNNDGKIYLIGSSYGAPVAASFAMQHPDLVEQLYLVSPVIDPDHEKMFWFSYAAKLAPVSVLLPGYLNVASDEKFAHRGQLKKLKSHWDEITCKTYVFMGEKDHLASRANLEFAKKKLIHAKDPEFYLLPNTGHAIIYQRTDLLLSLLLKRNDPLVLH